MTQLLYKYRSLRSPDAYKNLLDILVNERLYAANFSDLNDPMEGLFILGKEYPAVLVQDIKNHLNKWRICSLSSSYDSPLLWAHYADGGRGIALGVCVTEGKVEDVISEGLSEVNNAIKNGDDDTARRILLHKEKDWAYENEKRVLTKNSYVSVKLKEIIFGEKVSDYDEDLIKSLVAGLRKNMEFYKGIKKEKVFLNNKKPA